MKLLTLLRHAKASSEGPECADFDRPLNPRGKKEASLLAQAVRDRRMDAMLSSPALRARTTAAIFSKALKCPCTLDDRLYGAGRGDLLAVTAALDERWQHAVIVGHNPGLEDFACLLLGERNVVALPTCAWLSLELGIAAWWDAAPGVGTKAFFLTPKKLRCHARPDSSHTPVDGDEHETKTWEG